MTTRLCPLWLVLMLSFFALGCGEDIPKLAQTTGTVTYQGEPLRSGTILFTPDTSRGTHGPVALGKLDGNGKYTLYTKSEAGAVPGWHRVTVVALDDSLVPNQAGDTQTRSVLPGKYQNPQTSGLVKEVKADQANVIDFDLE